MDGTGRHPIFYLRFKDRASFLHKIKRRACLASESRAESFASLRAQLWVHTEKGPERHRTGKEVQMSKIPYVASGGLRSGCEREHGASQRVGRDALLPGTTERLPRRGTWQGFAAMTVSRP